MTRIALATWQAQRGAVYRSAPFSLCGICTGRDDRVALQREIPPPRDGRNEKSIRFPGQHAPQDARLVGLAASHFVMPFPDAGNTRGVLEGRIARGEYRRSPRLVVERGNRSRGKWVSAPIAASPVPPQGVRSGWGGDTEYSTQRTRTGCKLGRCRKRVCHRNLMREESFHWATVLGPANPYSCACVGPGRWVLGADWVLP